ncbi:ankyrin repeats (3 copies) domain-containing protein [Cordyceps javanica]|uniref:Ankyrin repeats (3 copies) domain-containing protein n=1 Tax=Cordyceps javanica TaxID=43265 RepID=A0A545UL88_9HYPO|nr:ankyrin repeats (3 copies) domain-containing protein [Cordyceps javanica]
MLLCLPVELVCDILSLSPVASQAALARTCHALHGIGNWILYRNDSRHDGSAAIFHAITYYTDQKAIIGTLQAAAAAGASLENCHPYPRRMEATRQLPRLQTCAPLYLAASRGLDDVVSFLIKCGVSIEGFSGASISPFWGAVLAGKEKTAMLLLQHDASETSSIEGLDAFHASIQYGLSDLAEYLVKNRNMDVNRKTKSGATPIMVAFSSRKGAMVHKLLQLGANVYDVLLKACHDHLFTNALLLLDAAAAVRGWTNSLPLSDMINLTLFAATRRVSGTRAPQMALVRRFLMAISGRRDLCLQSSSEISLTDVSASMEGLLRRLLNIDTGDTDMAILFMSHGVQIHAETFKELLDVLQSRDFCSDTLRVLRRHPKILKVLHVVHSQCCNLSEEKRGVLMKSFMRRVPSEAIGLIHRLLQQDLALTARGAESVSAE